MLIAALGVGAGVAIDSDQRSLAQNVALGVLTLVLAAGFLMVARIARGVSRPIQRVIAGTQRVSKGDLTHRVEEEGDPDLVDLARAFNAMTEGLRDVNHDLEIALRRTQEALRTKSDFLSNVSHELRTPLTSIVGFSDVLQDPSIEFSPEQVREFSSIVGQQARRLSGLITDILEMSRLESGDVALQRTRAAVADLIMPALDSYRARAREKGIRMSVEYPAGLPEVAVDSERIGQVLQRLLSNAVKFTGEGGGIRIQAHRARSRWHPLSNHGEELPPAGVQCEPFVGMRSDTPDLRDYVVITVADTGCGILAQDQLRVFEKFTQLGDLLTNKPQGAGLGLSIAARIVTQHGGALWLESVVGKGSTFAFSVPVHRALEQQAQLPHGTLLDVAERASDPSRPHRSGKLSAARGHP